MEFLFNNLRDHLAKQGFPSELLQGGVGGGFGGGGYRRGPSIDPRKRGGAYTIDKREDWAGYYEKGPIFKLGERGSGLRTRSGKIQTFSEIQQQCKESGELFDDPEFPCTNESVFGCSEPKHRVRWLRPSEIASSPCLFVDGASRFDVVQGSVGNCWMVAALANLTLNDELFNRVVPQDQNFDNEYTGAFHFRVWKANRWIDVCVDDRLPTRNGELLYMKSRSGNEFWSALLEKAYAKIHGSYEALSGGSACEAMEDFTGGITEQYDVRQAPHNLYMIMLKAYERNALMSCSITPGERLEERLSNGLVAGHAYSITSVKLVFIERLKGKMPLIRIRNPWGEHEWRGAWADGSKEWSLVDEEERERVGLKFDADGEFWMSMKDFERNFHYLELCNLGPDALTEEMLTDSSTKKWEVAVYEGSWVAGATAGGCRNYLETHWVNPQYFITLIDPDEDDDDEKCTMIVALMQKNRRAMRTLGGGLFLTIGFAIYRVNDPENVDKPLSLNFFKMTPSAARSHTFINSREVTTRFKLSVGTYCIVPSTFEPNQTGDFLLRVFTEKKNTLTEHDSKPAISAPEPEVAAPEEDPDSEKARHLQALFAKIAGDDLEVNCYELQKILTVVFQKELQGNKFSLDVCRSMISLMDSNHSGKLGLEDFRALWIMIRTWRNTFKLYDTDEDGALDTMELRQALHSAGYTINNHILSFLVLRYGHDGFINFDDFIGCAVKLRCMIEIFREKDVRRMGSAVFTIDDWLQRTMYC
ncbi:calpain-A-like isoform X2 [Varroa jacobsoni]|uniref:calpain-A-like isoform X2 n=1 Tax=Varroa jacobsoni TaxID=62625 RepID=UPI000BF2DCC7|nr:calpain-A-like isoform X2 [Varroa jacobsoni]